MEQAAPAPSQTGWSYVWSTIPNTFFFGYWNGQQWEFYTPDYQVGLRLKRAGSQPHMTVLTYIEMDSGTNQAVSRLEKID
jgi:hypothetical protein